MTRDRIDTPLEIRTPLSLARARLRVLYGRLRARGVILPYGDDVQLELEQYGAECYALGRSDAGARER